MSLSWVVIFGALIIGFFLGLTAAFIFKILQAKTGREFADELLRASADQQKSNIDAIIENVKASFGSLSLDALSKSTQEFLKLARTHLAAEREITGKELESKKGLIDQQLQRMASELEKASNLMKELEKDRVEKFGQLTNQLKTAGEQTTALIQTTNSLREALSSTKVRGQWGERMAEDVLRLAGFMENINYLKQKSIEGIGSRPDFTFLLPRNLKLNMDVKFPLENYVRFLETPSESDKIKFRDAFLKDVKLRIKEVTSREYINPEQNTIDYVLLFIPNEQIYAFIHEQDSAILDEGLRNKVVFCSPVTLFAILAIIRQAVDNFALEQTSNEILSLLGSFKKQWDKFLEKLQLVGKRIGDAQKEFETLTTTRVRQLERPLNKIEDLRTQKGLLIEPDEGNDLLTAGEEHEEQK